MAAVVLALVIVASGGTSAHAERARSTWSLSVYNNCGQTVTVHSGVHQAGDIVTLTPGKSWSGHYYAPEIAYKIWVNATDEVVRSGHFEIHRRPAPQCLQDDRDLAGGDRQQLWTDGHRHRELHLGEDLCRPDVVGPVLHAQSRLPAEARQHRHGDPERVVHDGWKLPAPWTPARNRRRTFSR
ncbi:MAG: hypothetical protein ACK5LS_02800 [Propioniciclava sp.]